MVQILDVILPVLTLVIASLLTIPVFKLIRKHPTHKTAATLAWVLVVFLVAGITVTNLALSYYSTPNPAPLTLTLDGSAPTALTTSFYIDAITIFMAIIIVAVASVILVYTVFSLNSNERPADRYFAVMLILTAALLGAVLIRRPLNILHILGSRNRRRSVPYAVPQKRVQPKRHTQVPRHGHHRVSFRAVWALNRLWHNRHTKLRGAPRCVSGMIAASDMNLLIIAFVFIAAGYAIEAAIVPFHFWLPDAYTAAPAPSAAFLSALVDQGSYYIIIRILLFIILPAIRAQLTG